MNDSSAQSIQFLIQGSAAEPYEVVFTNGAKITASCTCPAAAQGTHCKHRMNILHGVADDLVSDNQEQIATVVSWLPGSKLGLAMTGLADAETELETAKQNLAKAKKALARVMHG